MIGTLLGNRYEILEKIGEGGMAIVYKAKCHLLNRFVAVKILKDEYSSDKEFVDKFKAEAAAAGSISNSNIVNIYDVGSQDDVNYIIMEYVNGRTLKEVIIQSGRLDYNRALDIAIQIGKALECAHKNGIIHRDIKPQNILVTDEGIVKVTDFGIAKAANSATITNSNKVMGSAHYFSPEQAKGTFVDARTDIYSLGIVLYEMVTGRVPYDAESPVSVALKHLQAQVLPPKNININLPEGLNNLILRAMEKDAISRYQNIKDMLLDLQRIKNNSEYKVELGNAKDEYTKIMSPVVDNTENFEGEEITKKNGRRTLLILIPLALLVIIAGFTSGWYFKSRKATLNNPAITSNEVKI
ncbi:MAG: serine/threonine protein kinase, partial [Clostridiales bacterium]|nr:serine/threonine protein kinase [Clostridiales bacterium]